MLAVVVAGYAIWSSMRAEPSIAALNAPLFVDSETGQTFHQALSAGMSIPVKSPFTGRATGYEAELCYWTKDGKPKVEPTGVLLNEDAHKPGPTFCPDCGRLVVRRNPAPADARGTPPPTEAEYRAAHPGK